jgi:RLL motif-containing protein 1
MIIQDVTEMNEQFSNINSSDVDSIGSLLGLARNETENNPDYLQRISKVVSLFLTPGCIEALKTNNDGGIPLDAFPLGFDTGDIDVNQTATVLKMLYLSDFREMQNDLNSLLLLGQEYTANPRTNTKLGKVGR